ncbi:MAG: DUF4185 domain-containing protein [Firmicutes bacterium]|nr:DUF4185 domain-containing protein [Bacillota bacterium]
MKEYIYEAWHDKGFAEINLNSIFPVQVISKDISGIKFYIDEEISSSIYTNRICFNLRSKQFVRVKLLKGFYAVKDDVMSKKFIPESLWSGGDGIYSFPLSNNDDGFPVNQNAINEDSLFVFGDTFVGEFDQQSKQRIEPTLMTNNSFAYLKNGEISFHLEKDTLGQIKSAFELEREHTLEGNHIQNLLINDSSLYISASSKKDVEILYDFYEIKRIGSLIYGNYYDDIFGDNLDRSFKDVQVFESADGIDFKKIKSFTMKKAKDSKTINSEMLNTETRFVKIVIQKHRKLIGCRYLTFTYESIPYIDIKICSNQQFYSVPKHTWLWLQDGIIYNNVFYFYPMRVISDTSQPEGLQFKVLDTMIFKVPIDKGILNLKDIQQKPMRNYLEKDGITFIFGSAVMNHSKEDGYIYIYGYKSVLGFRQLIVSRVKPIDLWNVDAYEYFNGSTYERDFKNVSPILDHVSCEMSVTFINAGPYKDKFIAIMTYDTNTKYVAFSLGDSPSGPFTEPQKIFVTSEQDIYKSTTYTYNAKAHPHLSHPEDILISYNTNTYNFEHNMSHAYIYRPRFIRLKTIRGSE